MQSGKFMTLNLYQLSILRKSVTAMKQKNSLWEGKIQLKKQQKEKLFNVNNT